MTIQRIKQELVNIIAARAGDWLEKIPVITGNQAGEVTAGNSKIWVRFANGQEAAVLNTIASLGFDRHITIGRLRSQPAIWRVAEIRESYLQPASGGAITPHHEQHEFPNQDTVWVSRKQIVSLTILVSDPALFKIFVYGALVRTKNGIVAIDNQELDLAPYVPVTGAVYIAIECDETGTLSIHEGVPFLAPAIATLADVPSPAAGKYTIGFVMLYDAMIALTNEMVGLPVPLITDYDGMDTGTQIADAVADTPLNADKFGFWDVIDNALKSITWAEIKTIFAYQELVYEINVPTKPIELPEIRIDGALAIATGVGGYWIAPENGVFESVLIYCAENGSAGGTIVDVNLNGITIFTTSGNRPAYGNTDIVPVESATPDIVDFVKGDVVSWDIDAIATGAEDLSVKVLVHGYNEFEFITDEDGNLITSDVEII